MENESKLEYEAPRCERLEFYTEENFLLSGMTEEAYFGAPTSAEELAEDW